MGRVRSWAEAMSVSLHGSDGYYLGGRGPGDDFRTSATAAPDVFADAVVALLRQLAPGPAVEVVEVAAGTGAVLAALAERLPPEIRLVGVEQRPRPPGLPERVEWLAELPAQVRGLLLAVEWLDTIPVDVVVDGRVLLVDEIGVERPGPPPTPEDAAWLERWWPTGARREVGRRRDLAWTDAVTRLTSGLAVAVDYGHVLPGRPPAGTLRGYREGRVVPPVPDGRSDVTAAVAWDAVQAALPGRSVLVPQASALRALGVSAALPPRGDPAYAAELARASRARLLLDPAGLGGFSWLVTQPGVANGPSLDWLG
jgi:SAM-dependent MidA family methyltransferase